MGLYIEETVSGVCGITSLCPEHFCFEMKYCGPKLDAVARGDHKSIGRHKKVKETCVNNVIMMQSTPGQFTVPLLSGLLSVYDIPQEDVGRDAFRPGRTDKHRD